MKGREFTVAITGASGAVYGLRLVELLLEADAAVNLVISAAGLTVIREECGLEWDADAAPLAERLRTHFGAEDNLRYYGEKDLMAPIASGSRAPEAMIVAPCSMGTLSRIACGNSGNLVERAADVMLKEGRTLVLVPRETPLNAIHLEQMLKLSRLGVRIVPAMPAFYQHPETIADLVDFLAGKVLDLLGVKHALFPRWKELSDEQP